MTTESPGFFGALGAAAGARFGWEGFLIGGSIGSFIDMAIPELKDITAGYAQDAITATIRWGTKSVARRRSTQTPQEIQHINQDLQLAFRDAFREAVWDIGGVECFSKVWEGKARDVPEKVIYARTDEGKPLWESCGYLSWFHLLLRSPEGDKEASTR